MKRLKLITFLFAACFIIVAFLSFRSLRQFSRLSDKTASIEEAQSRLSLLTGIETRLIDLDRYERGYLLTRDSTTRSRIGSISRGILPLTEELKKNIPDSGSTRVFNHLRLNIADRLTALRACLRHADTSSSNVPSRAYYDGRLAGLMSLSNIDSLRKSELAILAERKHSRGQTAASTASNLRATLIGFGLVTLILFALLVQELRKSLRYQKMLHDQLENIRRNQTEMDRIAYVINHHLQEPLRKIRVFSDRLLRPGKEAPLPEATADGIQRLAAAAEKAQSLASDLAGFTALTLEEEKDQKSIALTPLVSEELGSTASRASGKLTMFVGSLPTVQGSEQQLRRVFRALFDNALKFASPDRLTEIRVDAFPVDGNLFGREGSAYWAVSITDNGIGFDDAYAEDIFKLFNRLHDGDDYEGKGLGLALAQRIMEQHGGHIRAKGDVGKGARFTLYFPAIPTTKPAQNSEPA